MTFRKATASIACGTACLLSQSCVEYVPTAEYSPTPQAPSAPAQYADAPPPQPAPAYVAPSTPAGTDDELLAPIALYPDPLIALILPASTVPGQISAASVFLVQYGDMTQIDSQPWDPSVRALAHYPTVVAWMADNMAWTEALGAAFASSPSEVMDAVQRLRARALAAGTLVSTPEQQVYSDGGEIDIYPARADFIYVPAYDDTAVYSDGAYSGYGGPFLYFGAPYPSGVWLSYYFDWGRHRVWAGDQNVWHAHGGWQPPRTGGDRPPPGAHPWHPPTLPPRKSPPSGPSHGTTPPHPRQLPGAPIPPPSQNRKPTNPPAPHSAPPQADRPRLNTPPPAQAAPPTRAQPQPHSNPPQFNQGAAQRLPGNERGPSEQPAAPRTSAPPARQSVATSRPNASPPAPHSEASSGHQSAPAPAQSSAPQPNRQDPQK